MPAAPNAPNEPKRSAALRAPCPLDPSAVADQSVQDFIRQAPLMMILVDLDMNIIQATPRLLADYGLTEAQVLGCSFAELYPDTAHVRQVHARCLAGEQVSGEAQPYVTWDGRTIARDWEATPWRNPAGDIVGVLLVTNDVTELFMSRAAAERAEDRLTRALHISKTFVWEIFLESGRVNVCGDAMHFFDRPPTYRDVAADMLCSVHPDDRPGLEGAWRALIERGESYRVEHRIARDDGREVWVMAAAEMYRDAQGRPERVIGVSKDITERKRNELAIAAARAEAEAANRAKSEFLANMSHEIRTPLNGVMGVAGVLKRSRLEPDQRDLVRLIESSAETLERLLADILDLARVESGRLALSVETFDVGDLAREATAVFEPEAARKGLAFRLAVPESPHRLKGDPLRLRQVLSNLCSNAIKFTQRGEVRVSVRVDTDGDGRRLTFEVADTGVGFAPEIKPRLFQRFEQADGSITRQYGGTGLGLAICRSLADSMGGTIDARSTPGKGSTFTFTALLAEGAPAERSIAAALSSPSTPDVRAPRVLLAEDHEINRRVVQLILAATPAELTSVCNGAEAVDAAARAEFDLILMDLQMPVMDGMTAIRAIRRAERAAEARRTPIVALTANAMPEHIAATREAGADGHLAKPMTAEALLRLVESYAPHAETARPALRLSA